jgi:putative tricarboxylic transport membrane protein
VVRNAQLWGGLFWLAIGAYVTWAGKDLGLGQPREPGSGFALFWIGIVMCGIALAIISQAVLQGSETLASLWQGTRWEKVLIVTVLLLIFGFLFDHIGFIICAIVLLVVLMTFIDPVPLPTALAISIGSTLLVWSVLTEVLKIQMPAGILAGAPEDALRAMARSCISAIVWVFSTIFR